MIGPITLTIIDSSLSDGWKAGVLAAIGMWASDLMFILGSYYGGRQLVERITMDKMSMWVRFSAAVILISIGIGLWLVRDKKIDLSKNAPTIVHGIGHAIRGFVVNTFSPFTLIFWPTIIMSMVFAAELSTTQSNLLFTGIMLAIITGDVLKAIFAGWIRQRITSSYMHYARIIIAGLFVFGGLYMGLKGILLL